MKNNYTDLTLIVDRSGSMCGIVDDTIGGINSFIESQRAMKGECTVSQIQFDHRYNELYIAKDINDIVPLTTKDYIPSGTTALFDAIGRTINNIGERLSAMCEDERPDKVIVVIITDGYENASTEFSKQRIKEMITLQEDVYNWDTVFLGANMDAVAEGASFGTKLDKTMTWGVDSISIKNTYDSLTSSTIGSRNGKAYKFSSKQRAASNLNN